METIRLDVNKMIITKEYPKRPKWLFHLLPRLFVELPGYKGFWLFGKKFRTKRIVC